MKTTFNSYSITYYSAVGALQYATVLSHSLRDAWSLLKSRISQKIRFHSATCQGFYFSKVN